MREVRVELGENAYGIAIGPGASGLLSDFCAAGDFSSGALIVTDSNVGRLYADKIAALLKSGGKNPALSVVPAGEASKSLAVAEEVFTRAIEADLDRKSLIVALGGGVAGDLAGFIAATYMRGVPFVEVPTSLLAQVDSSVGGKVAVNHRLGKNLIGAFYQPKKVFIDTDFLRTLPERELYTGLGEIVKYGVIYDEALFSYIESHADEILARDEGCLERLIVRSCEIKAEVVTADERESGIRRILNFGHTLGHAIEKATGYSRYNHGEAVAAGMAGAAYIGEAMGITGGADVKRLLRLLEAVRLPTTAEGCGADEIFASVRHDKKAVDGRVSWVLAKNIGSVTVSRDVPDAAVKEAIGKILR